MIETSQKKQIRKDMPKEQKINCNDIMTHIIRVDTAADKETVRVDLFRVISLLQISLNLYYARFTSRKGWGTSSIPL